MTSVDEEYKKLSVKEFQEFCKNHVETIARAAMANMTILSKPHQDGNDKHYKRDMIMITGQAFWLGYTTAKKEN